MPRESFAKFAIGQVVKHRRYPFRGVIYDVDPEFANTEEWWLSIPEELRPRKDQPFIISSRKMLKQNMSLMFQNKILYQIPPETLFAILKWKKHLSEI